jgi:hypothetical protein
MYIALAGTATQCMRACVVYVVLCRLQACRLANPSHVEVQMVFKGHMPQGHQQWDNNDGNNWQVGDCCVLCRFGLSSCRSCQHTDVICCISSRASAVGQQ